MNSAENVEQEVQIDRAAVVHDLLARFCEPKGGREFVRPVGHSCVGRQASTWSAHPKCTGRVSALDYGTVTVMLLLAEFPSPLAVIVVMS